MRVVVLILRAVALIKAPLLRIEDTLECHTPAPECFQHCCLAAAQHAQLAACPPPSWVCLQVG